MAKPLVSAVTPAFNMASFIGEALRSVLNQTYENIEAIVVDDGSDDETSKIAERIAESDPRVTVLRQPNRGVAAARNVGIARARGDFIATLDADDVWFPEKIESQMSQVLNASSSVGLVYGWYRHIDAQGSDRGDGGKWYVHGRTHSALVLRNFVGGGSMPLMTRACLEQVGGYTTAFREQGAEGCEDWDLYLRIAERYEFRVVPQYLMAYRRHGANMSLNREAMARSQRLVIEGLESRGVRVPSKVLRWAKARRCLHELRTKYRRKEYGAAIASACVAFRHDPIGFCAFLAGGARARNDLLEVVPSSRGFHTMRRQPYEHLVLNRFGRITRNGNAPNPRAPTQLAD